MKMTRFGGKSYSDSPNADRKGRQVHAAAGQRGGKQRALHPDGGDRQRHRGFFGFYGAHRDLRRDLPPSRLLQICPAGPIGVRA